MNELIVLNSTITAVFAVLGACSGSFVNVVALRRAEGRDFIKGRSCCPSCGRKIDWFDLIPVISWLILAGRCRVCKARISPRYLLVELTGATASALCFLRYGITWMTPVAFVAAMILLTVALTDAGTGEIPNGLIIALILPAIASFFAQPGFPLPATTSIFTQPGISLLARGIGFFAVSLPMLILALLIDGAFGGGDIKLMAVCGFMLGWQNVLLAFLIAVLTAGCVAISLLSRKKAHKGAHMAFGPHLCFGTLIAMLYGTELITTYLRLFGIY